MLYYLKSNFDRKNELKNTFPSKGKVSVFFIKNTDGRVNTTPKQHPITNKTSNTKNILVAPLNWGIGHATRCIPIIHKLIEEGYRPIIASDGNALLLLKKEFPILECIELLSYEISYAKKARLTPLKLLLKTPFLWRIMIKERELIAQLIEEKEIGGIISDNRWGVWSDTVPCVYITHQLNVYAGLFTPISSWIHQRLISNYDECWIPDVDNTFSGKLSNPNRLKKSREIGLLSRFQYKKEVKKYDILILLSGVEPSRSQLEIKIQSELKGYKGKVVLVQGQIAKKQTVFKEGNWIVYNFLLSEELNKLLNESELVVCRSGYSTIMDLSRLQKKAFFIPDPGQSEQLILAQQLKNKGIANYVTQSFFEMSLIEKPFNYSGFQSSKQNDYLKSAFAIFK